MDNGKLPTTGQKKRGRPPAFERDTVLEKATEVFWRHGYEGSPINDLTEAMGITAQSLYAAFTSKTALYDECLAWYQRNIGVSTMRALEEEADAVDAIVRVLRESVDEFTRPKRPYGCMISTGIIRCAAENEEVSTAVVRLREATVEQLRLRIAAGIRAKQVKRGTDAKAVARFVGAMIQGMSIQAHDGASRYELGQLVQIAISRLELLRST